jgi:hydrogenase maturation protease
MKTIIIGLGNPILTDDGIGVLCALEIEKSIPIEKQAVIDVTEASVGGIRLMEAMVGYDRALIIDAIMSNNDHKPGTIHKLSLDDLRDISPTQHSATAHDTSLVTALDMGKRLGLLLPSQIQIFAIEVENVCDFSDTPNPEVARAIPTVTSMVLQEIQHN